LELLYLEELLERLADLLELPFEPEERFAVFFAPVVLRDEELPLRACVLRADLPVDELLPVAELLPELEPEELSELLLPALLLPWPLLLVPDERSLPEPELLLDEPELP